MPCRFVSSLLISVVVGIEAHRSNRRNAGLLGLEADGPIECTELENFTTSNCLISVSPGACYVTTGESWSCWSTGEPVKSDQFCKQYGYAGACTFKNHGRVLTDEEIDDCTKLPFFKAQCNPTTDKWGACYVQGSTTNDGWLCVPETSSGDIERYRRGDCRSQLVPPGKKRTYTDVCRFPPKQQSVFRCETVPSYGPGNSKTNCGAEADRAACFSLDKEATWSCQEQKSMNPSCATTPVSTMPNSATYDGACLFQGAPGHNDALVYRAAPPTTAAAPTTVGATSIVPVETTSVAPPRDISTSTHSDALVDGAAPPTTAGAPTSVGATSIVPADTTSVAPPRAISTSTHSGAPVDGAAPLTTAGAFVPAETTSVAPPRAISTSTHSGTAARAPGEVAMLAMLVSVAVSCLQ